jgi:hypothetical protein
MIAAQPNPDGCGPARFLSTGEKRNANVNHANKNQCPDSFFDPEARVD